MNAAFARRFFYNESMYVQLYIVPLEILGGFHSTPLRQCTDKEPENLNIQV